MEAWFQKGRPALFEALSDACRQIDKDVLAGKSLDHPLRRSDRSDDIELQNNAQSILVQAGQVEPPRSAPAAISDPLIRPDQGLGISSAPLLTGLNPSAVKLSASSLPEPSHNGPPKSSPHDSSWEAAYMAIHIKHERLKRKFVIAKDMLERRQTQARAANDQISSLKRQIKAAEKRHGIQILDKDQLRGPVPTSHELHTLREESRGGQARPALDIDGQDAPPEREEQRATALLAISEGQTTHSTREDNEVLTHDDLPRLSGHPSTAVPVKAEPRSSSPITILERPVRKRKRDGEAAGAEEAPTRMRIKSEPPSSSPVPLLSRCITGPSENMDLGTAQRMTTPRKQKELEESLGRIAARSQLSESPTDIALARLQVCRDAGSSNERSVLSPAIPPSSMTRPLTSINVNTPRQARVDKTSLAKPLAKKTNLSTSKEQQMRTPAEKNMLDSLADAPFSDNYRRVPRSKIATTKSSSSSKPELLLPNRRDLPFDEMSAQRLVRTLPRDGVGRKGGNQGVESPLQQARAPRPVKAPSTSSLRNKPLSELRREDFKINPLNNDGQDYAFSEVVRDKDARATMSGCTDMHCCGKEFRGLALSEQPDPPLTPLQRQEQHDLLERYLGDDCHRLAYMSSEEKAEVWVEARTQELANKYGKHRHRYARMRSPPGFWNADFPCTQELESDRTEAAKREKLIVEDRYREASRVCGRWKFRDE